LSMVSDLEVSSICESIEFKKTDLSKCLRCWSYRIKGEEDFCDRCLRIV
jgi:hypothetical protein